MSGRCDREDVEQAMASGQWKKTVGCLAFEMIQAQERVAEAIRQSTAAQKEQSAASYVLTRGVFWLTCTLAAAALLQGTQTFLSLWGILFPGSGAL